MSISLPSSIPPTHVHACTRTHKHIHITHKHIHITHKHIHITHKYTQSHTQTLTHIYFPNTEAVRNGDLVLFGDVLDKYGHQFQAEKTYTLIIRLRHNVIKTGIRIISLSYSRISLADIAEKLQLDSAEDAEYIVAKVGNLLSMGFLDSQFSESVSSIVLPS